MDTSLVISREEFSMQLTELRWQDPTTKTYLGSPSIVRLLDGALLAIHDYFGPGSPRNHENEEHLTSVYRSTDNGVTWHNLTHIANAYWSTLFVYDGMVYLLGCSQQYGSIVIRRSGDGGCTWTIPKDEKTGLLFKGGSYYNPPNYHCAPVPILYKNGRIYRAFEDCDPCVWGSGFRAGVISAPVNADLLNADNWIMSNKLAFDPSWVPAEWGELVCPGWLEGNCVESPEGEIWNILRFNSEPLSDKAAIVKVHAEGRMISFNPATDFIDFPGGMTKFTIRRDTATGIYITLSNPNDNPSLGAYQRNRLVLCTSTDLRHWHEKIVIIKDDSDLDEVQSRQLTGFQYVDWQFDGDDIIYLVRTSYKGANNFHDSNRITYHRVVDFRKKL